MPNEQAPWPNNFVPNPGSFGALFNVLAKQLFPTAVIGTATTSVYVGIPHFHSLYVSGASIQGPTAAAGSGAVTATLVGVTPAGVATNLTAAYDLTAAVSTFCNVDVPILAAAEAAGATTIAPGGAIRWDIKATGTITGSPSLEGVVLGAIRS